MALDKPLDLNFGDSYQGGDAALRTSSTPLTESNLLNDELESAEKNTSENKEIKNLLKEKEVLNEENQELKHRIKLLTDELVKADEQFKSLLKSLKKSGII